MPSERLPAPNAASCSTYETGSVTVFRSSGSRYAGGRPAPGRRPPRARRAARSFLDSIIRNQSDDVAYTGTLSASGRLMLCAQTSALLVHPGGSEAGIDEIRHAAASQIGPFEWFGHRAIEVGDEVQDFGSQILGGGEVAAP